MNLLRAKFKLLFFILLILYFTSLSNANNEPQNNPPEYKNTSLLQEEVIFPYNSTLNIQTFLVEVPSIELGLFNRFTIFFVTTGSTTDNNGLKITLDINNNVVEFVIIQHFQDGLEHNLTKAFEYPNSYSGPLNISITCEGKSYSGFSGSLRILSSSFIVPIEIPTLSKVQTDLFSTPDWLFFKGSSFSTVNESVKTAFYNTNENHKLNISLFFILNDISVYTKFLELKLNGEIIRTENFVVGNNLVNFHSISLDTGLNVIECIFNVGYYYDYISISEIIFSGFVYSLEDLLPANTLKWVEWEGKDLDCNINLNGLKPANDYPNQILNLSIDYGYIGTTFTSPLTYEIFSGVSRLKSGRVEPDELNPNHNSLLIKTWTTNYTDTLTLRICGQTEGEGVLYILNTSKIEIEPIPKIKSRQLTRNIIDNLTVQIPPTRMIKLHFQDVINIVNPNSTEYTFALIYSLKSVENKPVTSVRIYLEIGNKVAIDRMVAGQTSTCVDGKLNLTPGIYQVNLTLTIIGPRDTYYLQDLFYQVSVEVLYSSDTPRDFAYDRYVIFLFIWVVISWILVERKERKNIRNYGIIDDSVSNKVNRWFHSILSWMKMSFIFLPLIFSFLLEFYLPDFFPHVRNFLSFLLGYLVFKLISKLERRKYRTVTRTRRIPTMGNLSVTNELSNSRNWFLIDLGRIPRMVIGAAVIAFFGLSTSIFSLLLSKTNEIIFTTLHPEHFRFGQLGNYLMLVSIIVGIVSCVFALRLAMNFPFVEDNLLKYIFMGVPSGITLSVSWYLVYVFISKNTLQIDFNIFRTLTLPIFFLIIIISCIVLGVIRTKQHNITFSHFVISSELKRDFKAYQQAIADNKSSRFDYKPYHTKEHRDALEKTITKVLEPEKPISLKRLAKLAYVPYNLVEGLLLDLLEEKPKLGIYYRDKKTFIPKLAEEKVSTSEFDSITTRIEKAREIAARDEPTVIFEEDISEEETNLEMKKTVKEHFQELYNSITGEDEDEKRGYLFEEYKLTPKESKTYLSFLKRGMGDKEVTFTSADREFLQRAWKKIHVTKDIFQRNSPKNLMREYYDQISGGHNGFDDVIFNKKRKKYNLTFLDYKVGDRATMYPWEYIPKTGYHLKRRELNLKQLITYSERNSELKSIFTSETKLGKKKVPNFIKKLYNDRNRQYHIIGNDWLIKYLNGDFQKALQKLVEKQIITEDKANTIIRGLIEQNQLIGLAQNGHTFRFSSIKKKLTIISSCEIDVKNTKIHISQDFFLPVFEISKNRITMKLQGFTEFPTRFHKKINRFIGKEKFTVVKQEDSILISYAKLKRNVLSRLFNSKLLNNLVNFEGNKGLYGLDTLVSQNLKNGVNAIKDQPKKQRGIAWFYDNLQSNTIEFLNNKNLKENLGIDDESSLLSPLISLLIDPETFFDYHRDEYPLSFDIYKTSNLDFFLFNENEFEHFKTPTFSFRKGNPPKAGIVLIDKEYEIINLGSSSKTVTIQLEDDDVFLNFPFRWDSHYNYFSFTQKGNKMSNIAKSWFDWLKESNLPIPSGSSGKISEISIIALLLEWWKRQEIFVIDRIMLDDNFVSACKDRNLTVKRDSGFISNKIGDKYKLAKVSVAQKGSIRHKEKWKFFAFYNEKMRTVFETLKAAIYDIIINKRNTTKESIPDLNEWMSRNWLVDFETLKAYFFD